MINRRNVIRNSTLTGASLFGLTEPVEAAMPAAGSSIKLNNGDKTLFPGDSITGARRHAENNGFTSPSMLGGGYAFLAAAELLHKHGEKNLQIYNKGISGNKVYQLADRWDKDCLEIQPNVLSILIGVND